MSTGYELVEEAGVEFTLNLGLEYLRRTSSRLRAEVEAGDRFELTVQSSNGRCIVDRGRSGRTVKASYYSVLRRANREERHCPSRPLVTSCSSYAQLVLAVSLLPGITWVQSKPGSTAARPAMPRLRLGRASVSS